MAGYVSEQDESNPELWLALLPTWECVQCFTRKISLHEAYAQAI